MEKVLITGGAGFIGSHLALLLTRMAMLLKSLTIFPLRYMEITRKILTSTN